MYFLSELLAMSNRHRAASVSTSFINSQRLHNNRHAAVAATVEHQTYSLNYPRWKAVSFSSRSLAQKAVEQHAACHNKPHDAEDERMMNNNSQNKAHKWVQAIEIIWACIRTSYHRKCVRAFFFSEDIIFRLSWLVPASIVCVYVLVQNGIYNYLALVDVPCSSRISFAFYH